MRKLYAFTAGLKHFAGLVDLALTNWIPPLVTTPHNPENIISPVYQNQSKPEYYTQNLSQMQKFTQSNKNHGLRRWMISLLTFILVVTASASIYAQSTTLLSPTGDGGFETGSTIAANNWVSVNSSTNQWFAGTVPGATFYTGNRCAFISNNGGTSWSYSNDVVTASHMYRDINVPAGQTKISLSFDWLALGEASSWDAIIVYTCPTTLTPVAGSPASTTGTTVSWSGTGTATAIGAQLWNQGTTKQTFTATLPSSLAGTTFRLVLTWKNDGSGGTPPPAAVDNISLISDVPGTFTSAQSGDWNVASTWVGGVVPSSADNAIINNGHTVTINTTGLSVNNLTINSTGILTYGAIPSSFTATGNVLINTGGILNAFQSTTGKTLIVNGNITNNGVMDFSVAGATLNLTSTNAQTVSGTGSFNTGVIRNLTFNNTNAASTNISWGANNVSIQNTLTFTAGRVNLNGNTIISGNTTANIGSLSYTAGGFSNGTFRKWLGTSTLPTILPSTTAGNWPFVEGLFNRNFQIAASTLVTTGGTIDVTHNNASGLATVSVPDGAYTIQRQTNATWTVTTGNGLSGGVFVVNMSGDGLLTTNATPGANFPRAMQGAGVVGTHANGSGTISAPVANRTGIANGNFLGTFNYSIGIATADLGVFSVQSGAWDAGTTWNTGVAPLSTENVTITTGHTVTVSAAAAVANTILVNGTLTVSASTLNVTAATAGTGVTMGNLGTVNISGGAMTVGTGATRFSSFSTGTAITSALNISSGTLTVNGNINIQISATFTQSGGTINVDGNAGGVAANSVAAGTSIFTINSINTTVTGGNLNIIDPHASTTASNTSAAFLGNVGTSINFSTAHTTTFGNGVSTDAGGSSNGFLLRTLAGSGNIQLGNVVVLTGTGAGTGTNRFVLTSLASGALGDLTVGSVTNTNSEFRTGSTYYVRGNITVNAGNALTATSTIILADYSNASTSTASTVAQTISGGGAFRNNTANASSTASFSGITINNTNATGVTFGGNSLLTNAVAFNGTNVNNSGTVSGTLTLTAGNVSTGTGTFILGVTGANGTLSYSSGGFTSGSTVARQFTATGTGTTITALGTPSSTGAGSYPFIDGTNSRFFYLERPATTGASQGAIAVKYNSGTGFTSIPVVTDGTYNIDQRSNANWVVTNPTINAVTFGAGTGTFNYAINATNYFAASNTNARLMQPAAVVGTFQAGTTAPLVQRTAIPAGSFANTFHIGLSTADVPVQTAQSGAWENTSTWVGGVLPSSIQVANILNTHTVTVNATAASVGSLVVNTGGTLVVSGSTLTVGTVNNNNTLINNGTLSVSGGTLAVNGNVSNTAASTFSQSGGTIIVDGNAANIAANSVASGTILFNLATSNVTLNGGILRIVDPHVGTATNDRAFSYSGSANVAATAAHTIEIGDGVSTDLSNNAGGFIFEPFAGSGRLILGNLSLNTLATTTNRGRWMTNSSTTQTVALKGNLTINSGSEYRQSATGQGLSVNGNITNNGIFTSTGTLQFSDASATATAVVATGVQTIGGTGTFRNLLPSATIGAGGSGYVIGDVLTLAGGTFTTAAQFVVTAVNTGGVTAVSSVPGNFPNYTVNPSATAVTTGGTGTGCTLTWSNLTATANFNGVTINNNNATGVSFSSVNSLLSGTASGTVSGTLTFTSGFVNTGTNAFILGNSTASLGTLSYTAGGFINGSTFRRWYGTGTGQATIAAGSNPTGVAGRFPFVSGTNDRSVFINQSTAPTAGGILGVTYNDAATISTVNFLDGALSLDRRTDANWVLSQSGFTGSPLYSVAAVGTGLFSLGNANTRLTLAGTAANGSNADGSSSTVLPVGQRTTLALSDMTNTYYLGYPFDDVPFVSVTSGDWNTPGTWNKNSIPTNTSQVTVAATHSVTVTSSANANILITATNGTLTQSAGTLTVNSTFTNNGTYNANGGTMNVTGASTSGITNPNGGVFTVAGGIVNLSNNAAANRTFNSNGTLTITSGTLNVFGNAAINFTTGGNSNFNMSGGNFNIDGNGNSSAASVSASTNIFFVNGAVNGTVNGGTITIVDPHFDNASTQTFGFSGATGTTARFWTGNTLRLGNGTSTDVSNSARGFEIDTWASNVMETLGNVEVNGGSGANRFTTSANNIANGANMINLQVNAGSEFRHTTNGYLGIEGNLTNNGLLTAANTLTIGGFAASSTSNQQVGGTGNFRNNFPTAAIGAGGSGYVLGDILTLSGGTFTTAAQFIVTGVSAGAVTAVTARTGIVSNYTVNPAATTATTGGTGTGCTLTWSNISPTASINSLAFFNANATGVNLNVPLSVSGTLTLGSGIINTTSINLLTLGTAAAAGTLVPGTSSATNMIAGPFARTFAASRTATGTYDNTTLYPVGKGSIYSPTWIDPTTSAGGAVQMRGEFFATNAGTAGSGVTNLSTVRWEQSAISGSANLTGVRTRVANAGIISTRSLLQATSAADAYGSTPGLASVFAAGTPPTLTTSSAIAAANYYGFFAYGDLTACTTPADQPTAFTLGTVTSTSITASFTAAASTPTGYLVVRYPQGQAATAPTNLTTYSTGNSLGSGTVVGSITGTSFTATSLTAATAYDFYIYSYNNSGCAGPAYNTTLPLTVLNVTTCVAAPVASAATNISSLSFTANWAAVAGATGYILDVSTSSTFTTSIAGYPATLGNVLTSNVTVPTGATQYFYRVSAITGTCTTSPSSNISLTTLFTVPWFENFGILTSAPASWSTSGWTTGTGRNGVGNSSLYRNLWSSATTGTFTLPNFGAIPSGAVLSYQYNLIDFDFGTFITGTWGSFQLQVSTDGGTNWTNLGPAISDPTPSGFITKTADLTPYAGQNVTFRYNATWTTGDYYLNFDNFSIQVACVTPTTQPTSLTPGLIGSGSINASFTAASAPGATGYLVLRTTGSGNSPSVTPVSGTAYTAGAALGNATVVSASNSLSFTSSGLAVSTTYRYTVYAYNDGCGGAPAYNLTSPLTGEFTTLGAQNYTTIASGLWSQASTWSGGIVPSINDNVTIDVAHTVTIDVAATAATLNITGTLLYEATTARTLTVATDVINNGTFTTATSGTQTGHLLTLGGNLNNLGTELNFNTNGGTAGGGITFTGTSNSSFVNSAALPARFRTLTVNKGISNTSTLEISGTGTFTIPNGFLTLSNGTLKVSTTIGSNTFFNTAGYTIPSTAGFWLNNAGTTVTAQSATATNNGLLRISAGTFNVGTALGNNLASGTSTPSYVVEGTGVLSVAGNMTSTNSVNFSLSGGTVRVSTVGSSTNSAPSFGFTSTAATNVFNVSGGTILIQRQSTATTPIDYRQAGGTVSITGGTLQFGDASTPASATFVISNSNSSDTINAPSIVVNNGSTGRTLTVSSGGSGPLNIFGNLTINSGATFQHNNSVGQNINLTGNLVNDGSLVLGGSGSTLNRFVFNGNSLQTFSGVASPAMGTATVAYPGIIINNPSGMAFTATGQSIVSRVELRQGAITGSAKITIGTGGASSVTVIRGGNATAAAGSFDVSPVYNIGTGGFALSYNPSSAAVTTGFEIPPSRTVNSLVINNSNNVTLAGGNLSTGTLTLSGGQFITQASNSVSVTGTAVNSVIRTAGWINGPVSRALPAGANTNTYLLPVGKSVYTPIEFINPTMSAIGSITAEFFEGATGGSAGNLMSSLNENGYWETSGLGLTSTRVRVTSAVPLDVTDGLAQDIASALDGVYDFIGDASLNVPANTISSADPTPLVNELGRFTIGKKAIQMVFNSAEAFQTPGSIYLFRNFNNVQRRLIGLRINMTNNLNPLTLNSITFNLLGSNPFANLSTNLTAVRVYNTGNSSVYDSTAATYGSELSPSPDFPDPLVFSESVTLLPGDNYFWLAVDVSGGANLLDVIDAQCVSINITGVGAPGDVAPTPTNPSGNAIIRDILTAGDYSVGAGNVPGEVGHFATLTAAVASLNDVGVSGPVRFLLTDAVMSGETFPITINPYAGASALNTVTIKPNVTAVSITGSSTSAVIVVNAADYVTIDGSVSNTVNTVCPAVSASRNLTITNTSTSATSAVVWLQSSTADSATNNKVMNCNLVGNSNTTTLVGVGSGSSSISTSTLTTRPNNNNSYINNNITRTQNGIVSQGVSITRKNTGTVISQNLINGSSGNNVQRGGILVGFEDGVIVSGNNVGGGTASDSYGISLGNTSINATTLTGNEVTNATVSNNVINNIVTTSTGSAVGIIVMSAATGTNTISNNMISGISSRGTSGDIAAGIFMGGGAGTTNIFHNSVSLTGDRGATSTLLYPSYAIAIGGSNPVVNLRNNIFVNTQTSSSTSTNFRSYAIALGYSTYTNLTSNNNNLFVSGTNGVFGLVGSLVPTSGTAVSSLSAWQTTPGKDANSKNIQPVFLAALDLHLDASNTNNIANLVGAGASVAVTNDIDCETRTSTPTIGADELVQCAGAIGGTAVAPANAVFCGSSAAGTTITASGYSTALGGTYQWQSSPDDFATPGSIVDIAGATNAASYAINPAVTTTTYYRLKVTCNQGTGIAFSNSVAIIINPNPVITIATPNGNVFCTPAPVSLALNGNVSSVASPTYQWKLDGVDITGANSSNYVADPGNTGIYRLVVTNGVTGCKDSSSVSITTAPRPTVTANANPLSLCEGGTINLTANGTPGIAGYSIASIPVSLEAPTGTPTVLCTGGTSTVPTYFTRSTSAPLDDTYWDSIPLPFNFTFYGVSYDKVRVSTNGTVQFGAAVPTGNPGSFSWTPQAIPTAGGNLDNFIAFPWFDQDPGSTPFGTIRYFVQGTAPNRKFVISYEAVKSFSSSDLNTSQVILNENTNAVDLILAGNGLASTASKVMGLEGPGGTAGVTPPGRSLGTWTTTADEAWRFTPTTISSYSWTGPNSYSNNNQNPTIANAVLANAGVYSVTATENNGCTTQASTPAVTIYQASTSAVLSGGGTICTSGGTSSANLSVAITGGTAPYTVVYQDDLTTNQFTVNNYNSGDAIPVSPASTRSFSLVSVASTGGCVGTGNSGSATVIVSSPSTAATITGTTAICAGSSANLQVNITGGTAPFTLVYNNGTSDITVNNYVSGTNIPVSPAGTTNYTITSVTTNVGGCIGTGNTGTATVTVNPIPTVSADSASFRFSLAAPQTTTLPYSATQSPTLYSITWTGSAPAEGFWNVIDSALTASPLTIYVPANVNAGTYTATISVAGNNCPSTPDGFTFIVVNANPTWTGNVSTDWNTAGNWSPNVVPANGVNVTINRLTANNPVLATNVTVGTLDITPLNTVTLNGNSLTVNGGIIDNTGLLIGSNTSNLTVGATSTIRFVTGAGGVLRNLTVNAGTATLATPLDITAGTALNTNGVVTVQNGAVLASGGNLTFKSNQFGTARLAQGATSGQWVTGNVTVERFIPANAQRAWRFLSVPTKGTQTINQAWQEGATPANFNPRPGFGTRLTTPQLAYSALGFDERTTKSSIQFFNQASGTTGAWVDVSSTLNGGNRPQIESVKGYSVYVRGERTQAASGSVTATTPTILRTTGLLYTGNQAAIPVAAGRFDLIGNTYVSPIDFTGLSRTGIANTFYLWDPKLVSGTPPNTSLGGYVTFSLANGWVGVPNSSSYGTTPRTTIQSGESFMIQANAGGGSITLVESAKVAGDGINYFRPSTNVFEKLKANLFIVAPDNSTVMADANVSVFDNLFSNDVDGDDAVKLTNAGENFAIRRNNVNLVVEGRQVTTSYDTTFFWMWNMRQNQQYRLQLIAENMNVTGRTAFLIDNYTNTTTQLDLAAGVTTYDFTVNADQLSSTANRFRVVYRQIQLAPVPVTFVSISATQTGNAIKVDWKVAEQTGIRNYVIERSANGTAFTQIGTVPANANSTRELLYSWLDATPLSGSNFYRIRIVGLNGEIKYSPVVRVLTGNILPSFAIAPNPVEGSLVNIQFKNQVQGRYIVRLLAVTGEALFTAVKEHSGGNSTQVLQLPSVIARGAYKLEIISPSNERDVQTLFINTLK